MAAKTQMEIVRWLSVLYGLHGPIPLRISKISEAQKVTSTLQTKHINYCEWIPS